MPDAAITVDDMTIQAGASTGIALYPQDGDDPAELLRRADAAMYEAKQSGRSHCFAEPTTTRQRPSPPAARRAPCVDRVG